MKKELILRLVLVLLLFASSMWAADIEPVRFSTEDSHDVVMEIPMYIGVDIMVTESAADVASDTATIKKLRYRVFHNNDETMKISVGVSAASLKKDIFISGKIDTPTATSSQSIGIVEIIDGKVNKSKALDALTNIQKGSHQFGEFDYELPAEVATMPVTITYTICN